MKAEVAFPALALAARTLKAYTTSPRWHTATRLLYLRTHGDTLTIAATTGDDTAEVDLPGGYADGACAITPDTLIKTLTAMRPKGNAATATVSLMAELDRLHLTVNTGPAVGLDAEATPPEHPARLPAMAAARPVTTGPVAGWRDLVAGVGWAAGRDPSRPDLAVVRLHRDHPDTVLMVEAVDRYRVHRARWGQPTGDRVDARMPTAAAERAVKLLTACDPHGQLHVDTNDEYVWWCTEVVRTCARTTSGWFPDLEKLREEVTGHASAGYTADRQQLHAALDTAAALAATTRHGILRIQTATDSAAVTVIVQADSGAFLYHTPVPVRAAHGPAHTLAFNAGFARQAVAFLDGPTITVAADIGQLAVYLEGTDRHAIVMQTAG